MDQARGQGACRTRQCSRLGAGCVPRPGCRRLCGRAKRHHLTTSRAEVVEVDARLEARLHARRPAAERLPSSQQLFAACDRVSLAAEVHAHEALALAAVFQAARPQLKAVPPVRADGRVSGGACGAAKLRHLVLGEVESRLAAMRVGAHRRAGQQKLRALRASVAPAAVGVPAIRRPVAPLEDARGRRPKAVPGASRVAACAWAGGGHSAARGGRSRLGVVAYRARCELHADDDAAHGAHPLGWILRLARSAAA